MKALLSSKFISGDPVIRVAGSKSESNRLLIIQALYPGISIDNLSDSDDTLLLQKALQSNSGETADIGHAGTAMRFLTAYFASQPGRVVTITGSGRMKQRPISILVQALRSLGAQIEYLEQEGFPPLKISGAILHGSTVVLDAGISSQYISALLLIAPSLSGGLTLNLKGRITSKPYIEMTCDLLREIGTRVEFAGNKIRVYPLEKAKPILFTVESDWSSASYFYSLVALSKDLKLTLKNYKRASLQGDSKLVAIYEQLGVETIFNSFENSIALQRSAVDLPQKLVLDLTQTPDIAQTIAVSCFGLMIGCELSGLHTLKIKETDRLLALKTELEKLGGSVQISDHSLVVESSEGIRSGVSITTYHDHRMAMAFAPLALHADLEIEDPEVVSKSFPKFWKAMAKAGLQVVIER